MRGAIAVRRLELVTHMAIGGERQPLFRHRRPSNVTAQTIQLLAFIGPGRDTRMQRESRHLAHRVSSSGALSRTLCSHCTRKCRCREAHGCARAANAKHRHHIVTASTPALTPGNGLDATGKTREPKPTAPMSWMQRLRRVFEIDLRHCPRLVVEPFVSSPKSPTRRSPLLRIHAPAALVRPCTSSPGSSRIATQAMASQPRRVLAPPAASLH